MGPLLFPTPVQFQPQQFTAAHPGTPAQHSRHSSMLLSTQVQLHQAMLPRPMPKVEQFKVEDAAVVAIVRDQTLPEAVVSPVKPLEQNVVHFPARPSMEECPNPP